MIRLHAFVAAVVLLLSALASPALAQTLIASDPASGAKTYAEVKNGRLLIRSVAPSHIYISVRVDVNDNGRIDPNLDVSYGYLDGGTFCSQYFLSERSWTGCGGFPSKGSGGFETIGDTTVYRLDLPLSEVSRDGRVFRFTIHYWNRRTQRDSSVQRGSFPLTAAAAAPAARPATGELTYPLPDGRTLAMPSQLFQTWSLKISPSARFTMLTGRTGAPGAERVFNVLIPNDNTIRESEIAEGRREVTTIRFASGPLTLACHRFYDREADNYHATCALMRDNWVVLLISGAHSRGTPTNDGMVEVREAAAMISVR